MKHLMHLRFVNVIILTFLITASLVAGPPASQPSDEAFFYALVDSDLPERYILLVNDQGVDFNLWKSQILATGYRPTHWFPPDSAILIVKADEDLAARGYIPAEIYKTISNRQLMELEELSSSIRVAAHAFRHLAEGDDADFMDYLDPEPQLAMDDSPIPPPIYDESGQRVTCSSTGLKRATSEYLLRDISINVILMESDGSIDSSSENWNTTRETSVSSEIVAAMNFMATSYNRVAALTPSFTYHYYFGRTDSRAQTSYEPITRPSSNRMQDCDPGQPGEQLWCCEILDNFGYSGFSSKWTKGQEFNGDTRISDGTDWAVTIFVADSYNDADGLFSDGSFAYGWLGGPWQMMTYDNDGWGITRMDVVSRHEFGHNFYALDEYAGSACTCSESSGYIAYINDNCENSCTYNGDCIMSSSTKQQQNVICNFTRGQIGWGDSDIDSVPDPVDIEPLTTVTPYTPDPTTNTTLVYNGTASIQKNVNQNVYNYRCDMNILDIASVEYRVDGGGWAPALPSDGNFDSASESYYFQTTVSPGVHTIETRAVDDAGQYDTSYASDTVTVEGGANPPGEPQDFEMVSSGVNIDYSWNVPSGTCGTVDYTIYCGDLNDVGSYSYDIHLTPSCTTGGLTTYQSTEAAISYAEAYCVVVAMDASDEGSYGQDFQGGMYSDRPPVNPSVCGGFDPAACSP